MAETQRLRVSGHSTDTPSVISWLERKAARRNSPPLRIHRHQALSDGSIIIEVDDAPRFLHLNGFTFAGATVSVTEDQSSSRSSSRQQPQNQFQPQTKAHPPNGGLFDRVSRPQSQSQSTSNPRQQSGPQTRSQSNFGNRQVANFQSNQASPNHQTPHMPKGPARFEDPDGIAQKFLLEFFSAYDNSRELVLKNFYDDQSLFSLSVTMRGANRAKSLDWSDYLKRSRNLTKVQRPNARAARIFKGQEAIYEEWSQLPKTNHPTFDGAQLNEWLLECKQASNLPEPSGSFPQGVNGLLVTTHGAFEDLGKDGRVNKRSFDRTFILGPGTTPKGVRVISDTLVLRPYSGNFTSTNALPPVTSTNNLNDLATPNSANGTVPSTPATPHAHPEVPAGSGIGEPRPGKSEEQLLKEQRVLTLSFETTLKLEWAEKCLQGNNWDMDAAKSNLQTLISTSQVPPEAFLTANKSFDNPAGSMRTSEG